MSYLVVIEGSGALTWCDTLDDIITEVCGYAHDPCLVYELTLTRRKRPRLVPVARERLIEFAAKRDAAAKLANVRNPFKGKPGLPAGSQHITKDETGELVIRPYQEV